MRRPVLAAGALAAGIWSAPGAAAYVPGVAELFGLPLRLPSDRGVALTFDDGPHPEGTPAVLEALAAADARATFFLVGEQVERYPAVAGEIAAAGHTIALHGYRHTLLLRRRPKAFDADLARATAVIEDATGQSLTLYRPPYGVFSLGALRVVRDRGLEPILWSHWGYDWSLRETPESIAARATAGLDPGSVILLHDADHYSSHGSWQNTAAALPLVTDAIAALGASYAVLTAPLTDST